MLEVIRKANEIIESRVNANMRVEQIESSFYYSFEFDHFSLRVIVSSEDERGREWIASRLARYVLNSLERRISDIYLDNGNFVDGNGNYKAGRFSTKPT